MEDILLETKKFTYESCSTKLPEIHIPSPLISLIQCLLVLFFLDVLHTLWCMLVCRNSVKLNFIKTGLKPKFGINPYFFSHELCLYITRFYIHSQSNNHQKLASISQRRICMWKWFLYYHLLMRKLVLAVRGKSGKHCLGSPGQCQRADLGGVSKLPK